MNETSATVKHRSWLRDLAIMGAVAIVLTLLAPFGTGELPLPRRLLIWMVFIFGGFICFRPVVEGGRALSERGHWPVWVGISFAVLLASLPTTLIVTAMLSGQHLGRVSVATLAQLYPQVVLIGGLVTGAQILLRRGRQAEPAPPPEPKAVEMNSSQTTIPAHPVFDRLSPALGRDILYIENEDHYVRVHTALGSDLILMRMGDAADALAGMNGVRVHRGWWVARHAVAQVIRADRAVRLRLVDGREVPVARRMVAELRASSWF